jgi:hypothetical protein
MAKNTKSRNVDVDEFLDTEECENLYIKIKEFSESLDSAGFDETMEIGKEIGLFFRGLREIAGNLYNEVFEIEEKLLIEKMHKNITGEDIIIN